MRFSFAKTQIAVTVTSFAALEARVSELLAQRKGFALATLNLDHLVKLRRDAAFRAAYAAQDLVTADGNPIVWMCRLAGQPVSLVPGSDAIMPLMRIAARQGAPVALVGGTEQTLRAARSLLEREVRDLSIVATIAPPMGFDPDGAAAEAVLEQVADSGARLCLVALGAPKQERFAALGRRKIPGIGFASVGASLEFLAGYQRRAPRWVRRIAMEWLWRALSDPKRLIPRYAACIVILPGLFARAAWMRLRAARPT